MSQARWHQCTYKGLTRHDTHDAAFTTLGATVQDKHPFRSVSFDERRNQGVEKETKKGERGKKDKKEVSIGQQSAT